MLPAILAILVPGLVLAQEPEGFVPPPPIHVVDGQPAQVMAPAHGHGHGHARGSGGRYILPPGPGDGWGFPNGAPDGYGWYNPGVQLPLGADRTPDYYFPRFFAAPPQAMFFPTYYNKYTTRGQRYLPYSGCGGGIHPASEPVVGYSTTPVTPYTDRAEHGPVVPVPDFGGEVESAPVTPGESDLIP